LEFFFIAINNFSCFVNGLYKSRGETWMADLIVLGSCKHDGLDKLFATDATARVLTQSKIPLLTVPIEDHHLGEGEKES
jgi:hypothetical protein